MVNVNLRNAKGKITLSSKTQAARDALITIPRHPTSNHAVSNSIAELVPMKGLDLMVNVKSVTRLGSTQKLGSGIALSLILMLHQRNFTITHSRSPVMLKDRTFSHQTNWI